MEKVKLMVVDDNKEFCSLVKDYVRMRTDIEYCGAAFDGISALQVIRSLRPDVILLDNVMPDMDGLGVLKHLLSFEKHLRPKVIMISAAPSEMYLRESYKLGAQYIMSRKCDIDEMLERCVMAVRNQEERDEIANKEELITSAICSLGVHANLKGYPYLRTSIAMVMENRNLIYAITKELYPALAKKYSSTSSKVERNIRHAIETAWKKGDKEAFAKLFGTAIDYNSPKPTNSEFIAMLADKLNLELKKA